MMGQNSSTWYRNTQFIFNLVQRMGIYLHFDNFFFSKFVIVGPQNWTGKKAVIEKTG